MMPLFRKKPVVIEANILEEEITISTLEGPLRGNKGDFLITGVKGENYPCKPDIFLMTYEPVNEQAEEYLRENGLLKTN